MKRKNKKNMLFDIWNEQKKVIDIRYKAPSFNLADIWWARVGMNVRSEIHGKGKNYLRPVLILSKVYGNSCIVIPLTSKTRSGSYYYPFVDSKDNQQIALLAQSRYLDGKRLVYRLSRVDSQQFSAIRDAYVSLIKK